MKKEKIRHYANVISSHADARWVTPFFFTIFFLDSFLLFIPVDYLLSATVLLRPRRKKIWLAAAISGFGLGLGLVAVLVNTHLQHYLFDLFNRWGYFHHVQNIIDHAQDYGYLELTLGVFTLVPSLFGVIAGVLVHLDPWVVWAISLAGKVLKLVLTVWVFQSGTRVVKRWLKIYLKTSW